MPPKRTTRGGYCSKNFQRNGLPRTGGEGSKEKEKKGMCVRGFREDPQQNENWVRDKWW